MKSSNICDVKAEPLLLRVCLGTYAGCLKICIRAITTHKESSFSSGTATK